MPISDRDYSYRSDPPTGHDGPLAWCPYPECGFNGTDEEVDDHRLAAHSDEPQFGNNTRQRPR